MVLKIFNPFWQNYDYQSLLIYNFTHVLLSLPTPENKNLTIRKNFNDFIWNKKK